MVGWGKLLDGRAVGKRHIVLVSREDMMGILLRGLLDHRKEAALHLLAVDDERASENLVPAMFAIDLRKAKHLAVCQLASELLLHALQVVDFLGREGEALLLVVGCEVVDRADGLGRDVHLEDVLIQRGVETLQHGVVLGVRAADGEVFLDTADARDAHVLGDFHGVGAPGGNHFAARTYETAFGG